MNILAIETSCDETAAAVLTGDAKSRQPKFELLSNVVHSQVKLHAKWGGVVPELAARAHLEYMTPVVEQALKKAKVDLKKIDYIAVTAGPGLIVSLLVGVEFAKGLSLASGIPLLPVNHMEGHLYSAFAENKNEKYRIKNKENLKYPIVSLVVSGGHTMLVVMQSEKKYKVVGSTVDDAAGEAFDKVARLLGLPYPGGPEISKLAEASRIKNKELRINGISFPRPMLNSDNFDFSFSGLKTAVRYYIESVSKMTIATKKDVACSFEDAAVEVLVQKTLRAAKKYQAKTISLAGGVSANKRLREVLSENCKENALNFVMPPFELCTDNAGMIAIAAYINLRAGRKLKKPETVQADSGWEIF